MRRSVEYAEFVPRRVRSAHSHGRHQRGNEDDDARNGEHREKGDVKRVLKGEVDATIECR